MDTSRRAQRRPESDPANEPATDPKTTPRAGVSADYTRLSVNINDATAEQLRRVAKDRGINITEAVRRAIALLAFIEDEVQAQHQVQVVDPQSGSVRELVMI